MKGARFQYKSIAIRGAGIIDPTSHLRICKVREIRGLRPFWFYGQIVADSLPGRSGMDAACCRWSDGLRGNFSKF